MKKFFLMECGIMPNTYDAKKKTFDHGSISSAMRQALQKLKRW